MALEKLLETGDVLWSLNTWTSLDLQNPETKATGLW